eukprot:550732_1
MAQQPSFDKEIISTLKIDDNGWNIQLFENQIKISGCVCCKCNCICCDAVELGCDHNDDDIFLYCDECLRHLVSETNNKCPIDGHDDPVIMPNRTLRRQISKAIVFCPYSVHYKTENNELMNKNGQMIDTLGQLGGDEKEGADANIPLELNKDECVWKGTLSDLINTHISKCVEKNNPTFVLKKQMKELQKQNDDLVYQNTALKDQVTAQTLQIEEYKNNLNDMQKLNQVINEKEENIVQLQNEIKLSKQENEELKTQLNEQFKLMQDVMNAKQQIEEKKNDDNGNIIRGSPGRINDFEFVTPQTHKSKLEAIDKNIITFQGKFGMFSTYWSIFGPILKDEDIVTAQFKAEKKGATNGYAFGFATEKFDSSSTSHKPNHACVVFGTTVIGVQDEFAQMNDTNEIEQKMESIRFFWESKLMLLVNIHVNMKKKKGWLWCQDDDEHKVDFNLPDGVQIVVGLSGTDEKLVIASNVWEHSKNFV